EERQPEAVGGDQRREPDLAGLERNGVALGDPQVDRLDLGVEELEVDPAPLGVADPPVVGAEVAERLDLVVVAGGLPRRSDLAPLPLLQKLLEGVVAHGSSTSMRVSWS